MYAYIEEYAGFLKNVRRKSLNTVESYKRDINQYITYLSKCGVSEISGSSRKHVLSYLLELKNIGKASSTVSRV